MTPPQLYAASAGSENASAPVPVGCALPNCALASSVSLFSGFHVPPTVSSSDAVVPLAVAVDKPPRSDSFVLILYVSVRFTLDE